MANARAVKAEQKLKSLCDSLGITDGGRKWLDVALDPFKDVAGIVPDGYPDRVTTPSVVQCIHQTVNVAAPGSAGGGNWDCNIFVDNLYTTAPLRQTTFQPPLFVGTGQGATAYNRGGLIVRSAGANTVLDITTTTGSITLETDVYQNNTDFRVLAIGFEVHNTTSDLNKQGAVTCWRISDTPLVDVTTVGINNTSFPGTSARTFQLAEPPNTAGNALDLPGSVQWKAEDGCYVVSNFIESDNKPGEPQNSAVAVFDPNVNAEFYTHIVTNTNFTYTNENHMALPTAVVGAYFSGLSTQTALTVNLTYFVEQFPNWQSILHRVSRPSCPEDFAAIELYTKIVKFMPVGVPVNDNFIGALISGLSSVASWLAPKIPQVLGAVKTAGKVIELGGNIAKEFSNGNNQEKQLTNAINHNGNLNNEKSLVVNRGKNVPVNSLGKTVPVRDLIDGRNGTKVHMESGVSQPTRGMGAKNARDPGYNRIVKYVKLQDQGNRWVEVPKNEKTRR